MTLDLSRKLVVLFVRQIPFDPPSACGLETLSRNALADLRKTRYPDTLPGIYIAKRRFLEDNTVRCRFSLNRAPEWRFGFEKERGDMQITVHPYMRRLSKPLACALALFALAYLLQVVPHSHANHHDEAACRLCQVAHLGVTPAVSVPFFSVPFISFGVIATFTAAALPEFFFEHSPSRAPPSFAL